MHPALLLLPALGLILGPRVWVNRVLREHDREEDLPTPARTVVREILDQHGLHGVQVEVTDAGDHYDPHARAVRLSRHTIDRRSLTAVVTAAHEAAHALQHAQGYPPFELRTSLARVAQVTGEVGTVLIIAVPVTYFLTRRSLPSTIVGGSALAMIATSAAAQLAALPTEMDASFKRALPMLEARYIRPEQGESAQRILFACSMTYAAASLSSVLTAWPWMRGSAVLPVGMKTVSGVTGKIALKEAAKAAPSDHSREAGIAGNRRPVSTHGSIRGGEFEALLRRFAKPLIRGFLSRARTRSV